MLTFAPFLLFMTIWGVGMWMVHWGMYPVCYLWRPKDDRARIARIVIELLGRDDWLAALTIVNASVTCDDNIRINGSEVNPGCWYRSRIRKAEKAAYLRDKLRNLDAAQQKFGKNVIQFARRYG